MLIWPFFLFRFQKCGHVTDLNKTFYRLTFSSIPILTFHLSLFGHFGRVTIFFRKRIGTVVVLRDFSGDLNRKKKGFHSSDPRFLRIFEWSSQTNKKPGHFHQPTGTPGHGFKTRTYGKSTFCSYERINELHIIVCLTWSPIWFCQWN